MLSRNFIIIFPIINRNLYFNWCRIAIFYIQYCTTVFIPLSIHWGSKVCISLVAVISQVVQPFCIPCSVHKVKALLKSSVQPTAFTHVKKECFISCFLVFLFWLTNLSLCLHFRHSSSWIAWITVSRFRIEFQPLTTPLEVQEYISI